MRVYYVCSHANDVFYVRAEDAKQAEELLRRQIAKYIFDCNLKDRAHNQDIPKMLGDDIIVEHSIRKDILDHDFSVIEDMTASAYIFSSNGQEGWDKWDIEMADAIGNDEVAASIESMLTDIADEENI